MPRTSFYNLDNILSEAGEIFLEHSFHGAALEEIIARTEFNRRAFYLEFGNKQQFVYAVLDHYEAHKLAPIIAHLEDHQGLDSIERFFSAYIALIFGKGCLLINMLSELGSQDEQIISKGRHYLDRLQLAFIGCLEQAQQQQSVRASINIEAIALQLTSFVQGFAINSLLVESDEELHIATQALLHPITNPL